MTLLPTVALSSTVLISVTPDVNATPTEDAHVTQLITEAQNDISIANTIIYWITLIFAVMVGVITVAAAIASFLGIREFRDLFKNYQQVKADYQQVRTDITLEIQQLNTHMTQMTTQEKQVKNQLEQLAQHFKSELQTIENEFKQFTDRFKDQSQRVESRFQQLTKYTEIQSIMEASYNYGVANDAYDIGDNDRAIRYYLRVLELQPSNTKIMERLSRAYSNLDEKAIAIKYLNQALDIDPQNVPALRGLALIYRYTDWEKANNYLEDCLKVNPLDYEAWDFLGLFYRDQERFDDAIIAHERAFSIQQRPETEFYLSILYARKGEKAHAKLFALAAYEDTLKSEQDQRIRPVWKILIHSAVPIMDANKEEASKLIYELKKYITTKRVFDAITNHLRFLLTFTGHEEWIPEFMDIVKLKET
jgi:tetratricopeptide (TPR) repeat protein